MAEVTRPLKPQLSEDHRIKALIIVEDALAHTPSHTHPHRPNGILINPRTRNGAMGWTTTQSIGLFYDPTTHKGIASPWLDHWWYSIDEVRHTARTTTGDW